MTHEKPAERVHEGDEALVTIGGQKLSVNEWHASVLGACSGVLTGLTLGVGAAMLALGTGTALLIYALGGKGLGKGPDTPVGLRTIRHEPWWFLVPFVAAILVMIT